MTVERLTLRIVYTDDDREPWPQMLPDALGAFVRFKDVAELVTLGSAFVKSYELDGDGLPPTHGRLSIELARDAFIAALAKWKGKV